MAEHYAVRFDVTGPGQGPELVDAIASVALTWVAARFTGPTPNAAPGEWTEDDESVRVESGDIEESRFWRLEWTHPDRSGQSFRWRTTVSLATVGADAEVAIDIRLLATGPGLTAETVKIDRPALVPDLVTQFDCLYEGHPLAASPFVVSAVNAETFVRDVLLSPERKLPLVVVSHATNGETAVDAESMADRLAALASVAVFDVDASWVLTEKVGSRFSCFNGSLRTYWPDFNPETDDPFIHKFWLPEKSRHLGQYLDRILLDQFAPRLTRHVLGQGMFDRVRRTVEQTQQEILFRELRSAKDGEELFEDVLEEIQAQLSDAIDGRDQADLRVIEIEEERDDALNKLAAARYRNKILVTNFATDDTDIQEVALDTVAMAVATAGANLPQIRFLPSAHESADDSPYHDPKAVYEALEALQECAAARRQGPLGQSVADWFGERGVDYAAHLSQTTKGKWGDQYRFLDPDSGERRLIQPHIRLGTAGDPVNCLRIHMEWDESAAEWVVGHVGRHLQNTKS